LTYFETSILLAETIQSMLRTNIMRVNYESIHMISRGSFHSLIITESWDVGLVCVRWMSRPEKIFRSSDSRTNPGITCYMQALQLNISFAQFSVRLIFNFCAQTRYKLKPYYTKVRDRLRKDFPAVRKVVILGSILHRDDVSENSILTHVVYCGFACFSRGKS
jgi:hypothetical protein